MRIQSIRKMNGMISEESSRPIGTIHVRTDDERSFYFGPGENGFTTLPDAEIDDAIKQVAHLLDHSMGGNCWAASDGSRTSVELMNFAKERGISLQLS